MTRRLDNNPDNSLFFHPSMVPVFACAKAVSLGTFAMGSEAFIDSISSTGLKQVTSHWHKARGRKAMPAWSDIQPAAMVGQLPILWSYRFDRATEQFTARLAGDQIEQIFGKSFRGLPLAEAQPQEAFTKIYALCSRVVLEPALYRFAGKVFSHLGRYGVGERIMLPLSSDGLEADGILGATEYRRSHLCAVGPDADIAEWLAVEQSIGGFDDRLDRYEDNSWGRTCYRGAAKA